MQNLKCADEIFRVGMEPRAGFLFEINFEESCEESVNPIPKR
jgi:hypothetical protein